MRNIFNPPSMYPLLSSQIIHSMARLLLQTCRKYVFQNPLYFLQPYLFNVLNYVLRGNLSLRNKKSRQRSNLGSTGVEEELSSFIVYKLWVNRNITVVQHPFATALKFRCLPLNTFKQSSQNLKWFDLVEGICDEKNQHDLEILSWLMCFLGSRRTSAFSLL